MAKRTSSTRRSTTAKPASTAEINKRVVSRIKRASEFEDWERILIYGRSGAGKTRLAATAPDVLLLDIDEKGTKSTKKDIDPWAIRIASVDEFVETYWYLQSGEHDHLSVAIDGVTGLQNMFLNYVLGEQAMLDASRDPDMPSRQIYGKVSKLMKNWITNYRNLDMHVVFTALTRVNREGGDDEEDEDLGAVTVGPAVSPAIGGHLEAACDTIGYLHTRQVVVRKGDRRTKVTRRRLLTGPNERYDTKDRNNSFGAWIDAPDIGKMIQTINGEEEAT
jgi:AAA domain